MNINKLLIPVLISLAAISFNACSSGDGSSNASSDRTFLNATIAIDVDCTSSSTASDIATYVTTQAGDSIVKDEVNTNIEMFIDAANVKKVCLVNGVAHIVR